MAHIAEYMVESQGSVGMNNYIARELSPRPRSPTDGASEVPLTEENDKYVWRMNQPSDSRKYQLFPSKDKPSMTASKTSNADTTPSITTTTERDRSASTSTVRSKSKEPNLIRRRKISVPELGPMTTVQEVSMDSPTIPGRPPLHERSISAPGNSWRQHMFGESMLSCISGPALDENVEMDISRNEQYLANIPSIKQNSSSNSSSRSASPKHPVSPKKLAPLVIPTSSHSPQRIIRKSSSNCMRSGSTPPDVPPKSARMELSHPRATPSPYTPMSASSTGLYSATTAPTTNTAPNSANPYTSLEGLSRSSPKSHIRNQSEAQSATTLSRAFPPQQHKGHRRTESEGASSIMDRGRPKKRPTDITSSPIKPTNIKRTSPIPEDQKAFEHLPSGHIPSSASSLLPSSEVLSLRIQAIGQASRFQVLSQTDVSALSRELRALDERCEYLRKTHRSLRSGRRNLHERICSYLRSPRVAKFSHESMLKQEEALSELDNSIDDWVSKLEQAENRRTRVRQKLLEHVAAAVILTPQTEERNEVKQQHITAMDSSVRVQDPHTPPRSPTKARSPSPERLERVVEEVKVSSPESRNRREDVHSIKIYADSDIFALLADVEEEINRMGEHGLVEQSPVQIPVDGYHKPQPPQKEQKADEGILLSAVAFEGMLEHKRSQQALRAQQRQAFA